MKFIALLAAGFCLAIGVVTAQTQDKVLTASLTVKTVGHTTAVHGKAADPKGSDFLFCIDQDQSGGGKAVNFTGQGRVIYRPTPVPGDQSVLRTMLTGTVVDRDALPGACGAVCPFATNIHASPVAAMTVSTDATLSGVFPTSDSGIPGTGIGR